VLGVVWQRMNSFQGWVLEINYKNSDTDTEEVMELLPLWVLESGPWV
jgi:hypothetical protein